MQYPYNAIINREDYAVILEHSSRKYLRKVARKKYTREYREEKSYVIVSGESKKNAISLYESMLAKREEAKMTQVDKSTKQAKQAKSTTKKLKENTLESMLDDAIKQQADKSTTKEAEHAKSNKKTFSQLVKEKKYSEALSN